MDVNNTVNVESSDRGLPPHKFMPMLGVHPALNLAPFDRWTALKRRRLARQIRSDE
jgi:hypothetical protein